MEKNQIVLTGIDTLAIGYMIGEYLLTPEEWQMLTFAKEAAQERMFSKEGMPVMLRGREFSLARKGSQGYEFVLRNDDMTVQMAARADGGASYPEVRVTFRSTYLWRFGWRAAVRSVEKWVASWATIDGDKVSRADFMVDHAGALPEVNFRNKEVVTRARTRGEFFIQRHLTGLLETGYTFGKGDVRCRVYDKRAEIEHSQKVWFEEIWRKRGWDGETPVTRVEFQTRRDFLHSMQVETVKDLEDQLGDIWRYLTSEWLQLKDERPGDSNRTRWAPKAFWMATMEAVPAFGILTGVMRITQRQPKVAMLARLQRGVAVSLVAVMVTTYKNRTMRAAKRDCRRLIRQFFDEPEFEEAVERRAAGMAMA